ncbi:MAG: hypothetical protein D6800_14765, partial [Candidatus Zixiibacteriota bacterium]
DNPDDRRPVKPAPTSVDPTTWRKLILRAERIWQDGTIDDINVETLQPPAWIAAHDARVGNLVPIPLDLVEMGLPKGLKARVLENLPCPPIRPGPGSIVLTTVNHLNKYVFELHLEDELGRRTTVRPTGFHKFYSADRRAWISADSINEGERLTALGGTVRLLSRTRIPGTHRVYNLTVEGEHVYHVTKLVVDGHNNSCNEFGDARFVTDPNGKTVDISRTPPGRYEQPNGDYTDVLQHGDHGAGYTHAYASVEPHRESGHWGIIHQRSPPTSTSDTRRDGEHCVGSCKAGSHTASTSLRQSALNRET